jgi:DNA-binding XRE family transcriptional regulator
MAGQFELHERVTWTHNGVERPGMVSDVREDGKVYYVDMADNLSATPVTVIALESELKYRPLFEVREELEVTTPPDILSLI